MKPWMRLLAMSACAVSIGCLCAHLVAQDRADVALFALIWGVLFAPSKIVNSAAL